MTMLDSALTFIGYTIPVGMLLLLLLVKRVLMVAGTMYLRACAVWENRKGVMWSLAILFLVSYGFIFFIRQSNLNLPRLRSRYPYTSLRCTLTVPSVKP